MFVLDVVDLKTIISGVIRNVLDEFVQRIDTLIHHAEISFDLFRIIGFLLRLISPNTEASGARRSWDALYTKRSSSSFDLTSILLAFTNSMALW
jgi:hypothetical protein